MSLPYSILRTMDEIEHATKVHKSIKEELRTSPVILMARSNMEVLHTLELPKRGSSRTTPGVNWTGVAFIDYMKISHKFASLLVPPIDDRAVELRGDWYEGGDHSLLMRMLAEGRVPVAWPERSGPDNPQTISRAYEIAKKRGYSVPSKFLRKTEVSFSEQGAFHAAHIIARGHFDPYWANNLDREALGYFKTALCQLTGQFIVPDPLEEWKAPYLVDQLWIAVYPNRKTRLIVLEVDGEVHLKPENQERAKKRDVMLAARGYEVYHAAGWWCRVDPYRVVCEFLSASGMFPNAHNYLVGSHFRTISDYVCDWCGAPLSRWDDNWIQEVEYQDHTLIVHRCCAARIYDELNY
jgi:hypothetical protein